MTQLLNYELDITLEQGDEYRAQSTKGQAEIIRRTNYFAQDAGGELYYYKDGVYHKDARKAIGLASRDILDRFHSETKGWSSHKSSEVFKYINTGAPLLLEKPEVNLINLKNGIYNVRTKKLEPHTADYRTTVQLNINYDAEATCSGWDTFINDVFPEEEGGREVGYEIVAWLLTPFTCSQKSIVLLGGGSNGKSVYIEGVSELLGEKNISNIPLQKLADRFTTTLLIGKLANIAADLPNTKLASTSEFKNLVGGDSLTGEYKNGPIFSFKPFARCLFACNELPDTPDNSDGFYRRLNIVQFTKTFKEDPAKKAELTRILHDSRELSGLFNKAVTKLPKVFKEGITVTESMTQVLEDHRRENDPVSVWLDEYTVADKVDEEDKIIEEVYIPMIELYQAYRQAGGGGQAAKSSISFGKALKRYRKKVYKKQIRIEGIITWVYSGIRLKTDVEDLDWGSSDEVVLEEIIQ